MSATWNVVIGSVIGGAGTLLGGWIAITADRRRLAHDSRVAVYRAWSTAASRTASLTSDAWDAWEEDGEDSPRAIRFRKEAERALGEMIPSQVDLMLLGVPAPIWTAAEDAYRFMRAVRQHEENADQLRSKLEPVFKLMAKDIADRQSLRKRTGIWLSRKTQ